MIEWTMHVPWCGITTGTSTKVPWRIRFFSRILLGATWERDDRGSYLSTDVTNVGGALTEEVLNEHLRQCRWSTEERA